MAVPFQTLVIPIAAIVTFAGVYAITPSASTSPTDVLPAPSAAVTSPPRPAFNPLAPAASGRVECYEPDVERKTCQQIVTYRLLGGNRYQASSVSLVSPRGPVVMEFVSGVALEAGEVCGMVRRKDLASARIRIGGRYLTRNEVARVWTASGEPFAAVMNRKVCTSYARSTVGLIATDVMDNRWKVGERRVDWVRRGEGYRVAS